jgi:dimethylhistidine N-methyltransferase
MSTGQNDAQSKFLRDVVEGLGRDTKELPCKYFYDKRGSELFERISELDEYYVTRTELAILRTKSSEIANAVGSHATIVEFGSGAGIKTRILLDTLDHPKTYLPVDVSSEQLSNVAASLAKCYPSLEVSPVNADFSLPFQMPDRQHLAKENVLVYFPGSTIGTFLPDQGAELLTRMREICGPLGSALIGFDLHKDINVLHAAYNDKLGVTAEFNLNLLHHINRELGGNFQVGAFRHVAEYNTNLCRIELSLESRQAQRVSVAGNEFEFSAGERIRTEYSYKYRIEGINKMAKRSGFRVQQLWHDELRYFALAKFDAV